MRKTEAKGYFLKEYGSWSVLIVSYIIGLSVSRTDITWLAIPLFLALGLLINSKQAFAQWMRRKGERQALFVFLVQLAVAAILLFAIFGSDVPRLLPMLIFPLAYLLMNRFAGEHFILTEVLGFALISLAAVLAKFLVTGGIDVRLFIAVAFYFTAGVFKIKALLRKRAQDRVLAALYVLLAAYAYDRFHISLIILLPLVDNVIAAATLYKVKLQTTGWIEVAKSLLFLVFMVFFY
jgi:hypothetical protein